MYQRAFVVVSDERFFPGLWALLNSISAYYGRDYRVFVVGHRLSAAAKSEIASHPLGYAITLLDDEDFAYRPSGAWESKQCVFSQLCGRVETVCLLDADLVLLSRIDDVFEWAEGGQIVSSQDGTQELLFDDSFRSYGKNLIGTRLPYFNSGFLCLNLIRHWQIAALWEFTSRFAAYSPTGGHPYSFVGHGDQGLLNAVIGSIGKQSDLKALPQELWCNSAGWSADETVDIVETAGPQLVTHHRRFGLRQRLLHSTGPKWWTPEGREHFGRSGDVMRCFEHFANLHPQSESRPVGPIPSPSPGSLRYVGDISRQDAQILAEYAAVAPRILEFGVGASTQVIAQIAMPGAAVTTVDTDVDWIRRTQENFVKLAIRVDVRFVTYEEWLLLDVGLIDLAFIDGAPDLRPEFMERAWGFLRVGGVILVHDTRRSGDAVYVLEFVKAHHLEVAHVELNARASNITILRKKIAEPYVNWNAFENLES